MVIAIHLELDDPYDSYATAVRASICQHCAVCRPHNFCTASLHSPAGCAYNQEHQCRCCTSSKRYPLTAQETPLYVHVLIDLTNDMTSVAKKRLFQSVFSYRLCVSRRDKMILLTYIQDITGMWAKLLFVRNGLQKVQRQAMQNVPFVQDWGTIRYEPYYRQRRNRPQKQIQDGQLLWTLWQGNPINDTQINLNVRVRSIQSRDNDLKDRTQHLLSVELFANLTSGCCIWQFGEKATFPWSKICRFPLPFGSARESPGQLNISIRNLRSMMDSQPCVKWWRLNQFPQLSPISIHQEDKMHFANWLVLMKDTSHLRMLPFLGAIAPTDVSHIVSDYCCPDVTRLEQVLGILSFNSVEQTDSFLTTFNHVLRFLQDKMRQDNIRFVAKPKQQQSVVIEVPHKIMLSERRRSAHRVF